MTQHRLRDVICSGCCAPFFKSAQHSSQLCQDRFVKSLSISSDTSRPSSASLSAICLWLGLHARAGTMLPSLRVHLFNIGNMQLGDNLSIHQMCYIDATGGLIIGSDVAIAHATTIMTTDHDYSDPLVTTRDAEVLPAGTDRGRRVGWSGCSHSLGSQYPCPQCDRCRAVVTNDVPGNSLMAGVPARRLKGIRQVPYETPGAV